ncbi:MAG: protein translocase subunit SecF [Candidatus Marinimicrobia bacterium]|nr:protein translocase subunit SecF [Candidatus Neomarinimicrobiota bacterium]
MLQFFKDPKYNIVNKRRLSFILSLAVILAGIVSLFLQGLNYGVDFSGGAKMQIEFEESISADELRARFTEKELGNPEIKSSGPNEYMITINADDLERSDEVLQEALSGVNYTLLQTDKVGPKIGYEMRSNSVKAIGIALILVLIYITVRFEFKFAVGAVTALAHDVLVTIGIFSIFQWEISMPVLAAFLTIVGYSLNDTIVVYDRIRENIKVHKGKALSEVIRPEHKSIAVKNDHYLTDDLRCRIDPRNFWRAGAFRFLHRHGRRSDRRYLFLDVRSLSHSGGMGR